MVSSAGVSPAAGALRDVPRCRKVVVEILFFGAGLGIYLTCTRARDRVSRYGFWSLIAFLFFGWIGTLLAGAPPNVASIAWGGLAMLSTVLWGGWADQHRAIVYSPQ
jgi:putative exporter of polyketide antibiotics